MKMVEEEGKATRLSNKEIDGGRTRKMMEDGETLTGKGRGFSNVPLEHIDEKKSIRTLHIMDVAAPT